MSSEINQTKQIGGLDFDNEVRDIAPTDYIYAKNVQNAINSANQGNLLNNVMGNLAIQSYILPYSPNGQFPAGINRCIGAKEDSKTFSVIFLVWNSNGNHQILRYYEKKTDPLNPYGIVEQVMMYNFGWQQNYRITSISVVPGNTITETDDGTIGGDLVYFPDPIPKKLNLDKANVCFKNKSWIIYAPSIYNAFQSVGVFRLFLTDINGNSIFSLNFGVPAFTNNADGLAYISETLNIIAGEFLQTTACECSISIVEVGTNGWNMSLSGYHLWLSPDNWYGPNLVPQFWDRCKWPDMQAPQCQYNADSHFIPNYVQNQVFQFRLLYSYDDGEQAVPGVWSQIPINNLQCDGSNNPLLNYIDINFNDTNLLTPQSFVLLRQVWIIARIGNTGVDKIITQLNVCDFLDFDGTNWYCHYRFYNDIIPTALDAVTAAKLYDAVPLTANAEEFTHNRMVEGGIVENYNAPECANASYKVKINPSTSNKLWNVTGNIRILTYGLNFQQSVGGGGNHQFGAFFPSARKYPFWPATNSNNNSNVRGGIFHDTSRPAPSYPFFGGGGFDNNGTFGIRAGMETTFNQQMPEGGWPVYAAGTEYVTISKQKSVGLPTDTVGALDTSTTQNIGNIGNYFGSYNSGGDIYSTFNLLLPNGVYIIRLASHWCSVGDKLGYGFPYNLANGTAYQKTSTNVNGVWNSAGQWMTQKELTVTVNNGDVFIGTFCITDIAPPENASTSGGSIDSWLPINLYLYDSSQGGTAIYNPNQSNFNGESVEKALLLFGETGNGYNDSCTTDHNGYLFGIAPGMLGWNQICFQVGTTNDALHLGTNDTILIGPNLAPPGLPPLPPGQATVIWFGTLTNLYTKTLQFSDVKSLTSLQLEYGITTTLYSNSRGNCSTIMKGNVVDQNNKPISGATVVYETGRVAVTDINGNWEMLVWGDFVNPNQGNFSSGTFAPTSNNDRTVDFLLFFIGALCNASYPFPQFQSVSIQYFGGLPYNPTHPYIFGTYEINELVFVTAKKLKRGGAYRCGVRYYDNAGRLCTVTEWFQIYIPFETEDLSLYPYVVDQNGNPFPAGSYLQGQPDIIWTINYAPPQFAVTYQIMRTVNMTEKTYLQWTINAAQYVSQLANATLGTPAIDTAYSNGDAVAVFLDISNIAEYAANNPGVQQGNTSQVGYTWTQGDRVRLMFDQNQNLLHSPSANLGQTGQMYDFPITGIYTPTTGNTNPNQLIVPIPELPFEIQSGFTIEIYTPRQISDATEQIYYEVGEVFECTTPGTPGNQHGTTTSTFTNGDTYWRGRLINVNNPITSFIQVYAVLMEAQNISDLYSSTAEDIGRIGLIDPNFVQLNRPTLMRVSGQYQSGTALNGLSSFNALDQQELDRGFGRIQRLVFTQNNLVAIMSSREVSNYIGMVTMKIAQSDSGVEAIADQFFGTQYPHVQKLGTDFPGSVFANSGHIFGVTVERSNAWVYDGNPTSVIGQTGTGEQVISDVKAISFFKQLTQDGVSDMVAVYDRYHEEYILTYWRNYELALELSQNPIYSGGNKFQFSFVWPSSSSLPQVNQLVEVQFLVSGKYKTFAGSVLNIETPPFQGAPTYVTLLIQYTTDRIPLVGGNTVSITYSLPETLAWNHKHKRWKTFYDFTPECYAQAGDDIVSFIDGKIWLHGYNPVRNNFYGVQYATSITPVFNNKPDMRKVWQSVILETLQDNFGMDWSAPVVKNSNNQLSRINNAGFKKRTKEQWFAPFKRDLNDISTPANIRISQGSVLRSTSLTCQLVNGYTGLVTLYSWSSEYNISELSGR